MGIMMNLITLLVLITGVTLLQIFLSKKENKWLGRILPIITFSSSILITLTYLITIITGTPTWDLFMTLLLVFILYNISTVALYAIYKAYRDKMNRNT